MKRLYIYKMNGLMDGTLMILVPDHGIGEDYME